ncbi:hypothetical protein [Streptomyces venezuelae]|uniref:hypothetical protein n=1 Tax=Streptomyces venezuelae TaxID=54571 RepID=UPI0037D2CE45
MTDEEFTPSEGGAQGEFVQHVEPIGASRIEELTGLSCPEGPERPGLARGGPYFSGEIAGQLVFADGLFQC